MHSTHTTNSERSTQAKCFLNSLRAIAVLAAIAGIATTSAAPCAAQQASDGYAMTGGGVSPTMVANQQQNLANIQQWFVSYDQVRRAAQMNPQERQKADGLLSKGLSIIVPGEEKVATQALLTKLVNKYQMATDQMKRLPLYPETEKLHRGYYQYFNEARKLFSDYLKVQTNLFVVDEQTGKPLAGGLMLRKQNLEMLDQNNKALDEQLRNQFGIAPYQY